MPAPVATPPAAVRPTLDLKAAARALGASGGGAGAAQLLGLLCNPEVEAGAVRDCLRGEPALSARVLKVANSPFYRQAGQIGTVDRAVQLLGLSAIRGIAAAGCLDRAAPARAGQAFEPGRFRRHSLAVACATQQLSRAAQAGIDSEAFIAGLLHDIGVLLLTKAAPAAMASFAPPAVEASADGLAAERMHFGADHAACAGVLVEAWGLPTWLHDTLTAHHEPPPPAASAGLAALPALLHLADGLAARAGFPLWPLCDLAPAADGTLPLGLTAADLERIVEALPEAVAAIAAGT
jgi:HD-like signal output (HDOD) protein